MAIGSVSSINADGGVPDRQVTRHAQGRLSRAAQHNLERIVG
jgi:hypothetical protein